MGKMAKQKGKVKNRATTTETNVRDKQGKQRPVSKINISKNDTESVTKWVLFLLVIAAVCYIPMLNNQFTNWDDEYYVLQNELIKGPDWSGIFSEPVVSNYHPVTIISLAINYAISGLDPSSYLWMNYLLHLVNTALVFYFVLNITNKNTWISFFTALIFAIHPMHVESVAWVSERKDLLYTLFFLLSMMQYWKYVNTGKSAKLWIAFLFFGLSLLSKPAAVVLPLALLLLDYWKGRSINKKVLMEKVPFFLLALLFGVLTVQIQSEKAIAGLDLYPLWSRFFFGTYVLMIYFIRFFIPYPLSAFHPYPAVDNLGWAVYISPLFIAAAAVLIWYNRKNKWLVFGAGFFIVNLLLVMQVLSIGATIVSERYTYVPYIGLAMAVGYLIQQYRQKLKSLSWLVPLVVIAVFGYMTFERTKVWKDSGTLWTDVIEHYPNESIPRTNRANHSTKLAIDLNQSPEAISLYTQALEDCNVALKKNANDIAGLETRQNVYLNIGKDQEAMVDAEHLIKLAPDNYRGHYTKGVVHTRRNEVEGAIESLSKAIALKDDLEHAYNMRGSLYVNGYQNYNAALNDFNRAIALKPDGNYYMNRSICYLKMGDLAKAKSDAISAMQNGAQLPESYKQSLGL